MIGNNLVNIFASVLAGALITEVFGSVSYGIISATIMMFLLILVFSEATPKALGMRNEMLALRVARPLAVITKLFHPMVVALNAISNGIIRALGGKKNGDTQVTEDEIKAMMRLGEEEGTIEKDERELVDEVFDFDETIADEAVSYTHLRAHET